MKRVWLALDAYEAEALSSSRNGRGMILPLTLMILVVLASIVSALLALGALEPQIASNVLRANQALNLAEAGAERAVAQFIADPGPVNCAMATADDGCPTPTPTATTTLFNSVNLTNAGTYTVTYRPIGFATLVVDSTGQTSIGGAQRTVRVILSTHFTSKFALLGDGGVKVKKDSKVKGNRGSAHDNTKTHIHNCDGVCVEQTATSSGDKESCKGCTDPERVGIPGLSGPGKPKETLPKVSPLDLKAKADYVLGDDGKVYDAAGNVIADTKTKGKDTPWNGWSMSGKGEWVNDSDTPPPGTYYASKRIRIVGNPGAPGAPWKATLIAGDGKHKGTVNVRGDAVMEPDLPGLLMVAGKVKLKYTPADDFALDTDDQADDAKAKETDDLDDKKDGDDEAAEDADDDVKEAKRVRPRGYMDLTGTIIATSHKDTDKGKAKGRVKLSGQVRLNGNIISHGRIELHKGATVTYNVGSRARFLGPLQILSWSTVTQ